MKTILEQEYERDRLLQERALMGLWKDPHSVQWVIVKELDLEVSGRTHEVTISMGSYKPHRIYKITRQEAIAKAIGFRDAGWSLRSPQYPSLEKYFKNGNPITAATLFADALDSMEVTDTRVEAKPMSGIDFLIASYK